MGEIVFIRHGQASFGAQNYDALSPLGHRQSRWLGAYLNESGHRFDHVVSGTLRRHRETLAGIIQSLPHPAPQEDARLNEMSFFDMERAYAAQNGPSAPPEGPREIEAHFLRILKAWQQDEIIDARESFAAFRTRILAALAQFQRPGERVLIVSSGGVLGVILGAILELDLQATTEIILGTYNASISRLRVVEQGLRLAQYNNVAHLEGPGRRHALTYL